MAVTKFARSPKELADLVLYMIEIEHTPLDFRNMRLEHDTLIIPAIVPDPEPCFELEDENSPHGLWVHKCRRARLLIHEVERLVKTPDAEAELLTIIYHNGNLSIYDVHHESMLEANVRALEVELQVDDEVVDILTVYEWPDGGQMLGFGADSLRDLCEEAGIPPPDIPL
ncbi:MAG: hypothetical protein ACYC2Y_11475 [Armatimonadota bacterium]